ncbi:MAG: ABC transporter ATP-binding protein [Myxococcota bacterium]
MSTVDDHERRGAPASGRPIWLRILAYARPYVSFVALTMLLTVGVAGAEFARAFLLKGLIDDVGLPLATLQPSGSEWLDKVPFLGGGGEPETAEPATSTGIAQRELTLEEQQQLADTITRNALPLVGLAMLIAVAMPTLSFFRGYVTAYALGRMNVDMAVDACAKILALPLGFHHGTRRGEVLARIGSDLRVAHGSLALLFSEVARAALTITVGVIALLAVSWKLSLALVITGPLIFGTVSGFGRRIRRTAMQRQQQVGEVSQSLLEIIQGIKVIKAFRAEAAEHEAYRRGRRRLFKRSMRVVRIRLLARTLIDFLNQVMTVIGLCIGLFLLVRGLWDITLGDLAAFFLISSFIYRPLKKLAQGWVRFVDSMAGAERFLELMDAPIEIRDSGNAADVAPLSDRLAFRNVSFAYTEEPVLKKVDFEAKVGEVIAIVGRTGAGKTTLVDLIMRMYDPQEGEIELDGVPLTGITRNSLLAQIAVVGQEPFLFDGSIRDNLRYGRPDATEDELMAAARAAHVDEFVRDLPEGYDTEVGPVGMRLSGGQRQRVTIARAILRDPAILILDEATSSLDSQSEKFVQQAVDALLGSKRTVFVIAHRLSTVRRADRILVLEDGTLSQQGTHEELLASGGLYRDLLELQIQAS